MSKTLETWGIVVIHGVGFTEPGDTLERFFRVLVEERGFHAISEPRIRLLPQNLRGEERFPSYTRLAETAGQRPVLLGEVYWGDLSKSENGIGHLLLRILTIVFHLRYLIDCAAAHPCQGRLCKWQRFTLWLGSWILCGHLAGIYLLPLFFMLLELGLVGLEWLMQILFPPNSLVGPGPMEWFDGYSLCTYSVLAVLVGTRLFWLSHTRRETWGGTWRYLLDWFLAGATVSAACTFYRAATGEPPLRVHDVFEPALGLAALALVATICLVLVSLLQAGVLIVGDWSNRAAYGVAIGAAMTQNE